jgi:hypothetical protein
MATVKKDNSVVKAYKFTKGNINLNFSLRLDTKSELRDFLELLKVAVLEVESDINTN